MHHFPSDIHSSAFFRSAPLLKTVTFVSSTVTSNFHFIPLQTPNISFISLSSITSTTMSSACARNHNLFLRTLANTGLNAQPSIKHSVVQNLSLLHSLLPYVHSASSYIVSLIHPLLSQTLFLSTVSKLAFTYIKTANLPPYLSSNISISNCRIYESRLARFRNDNEKNIKFI